jgi:hypothetical protein
MALPVHLLRRSPEPVPHMRSRSDHRAPLRCALLALCLGSAACDQRPVEPVSTQPTDTAQRPDSGQASARPYLVLLSLDGFRPDYLTLYPAPNLQRIVQRGTTAESLAPVFPTSTFPNHYTQVTGLYPERHGIVGNSFWDPQREQQFSIGNRVVVEDGSWYRGEPIWLTAERQGVRAGSYYWVGSEATGLRPTYWKVYDGSVPNAARVDSVLSWLRLPDGQRPRLVTLYMSTIDGAGHQAGPHTTLVRDAVAQVDQAVGRLLDGIDALPQRDSVYLLVMSDHGMARYESEEYEVLAHHIDLSTVRVATAGTYASLHVHPGGPSAAQLRDQLNAGLQHGRAYLRAELPERLRYRADPRIGDVVVLMNEPYHLIRSNPSGASGGNHGWDPDNPAMQGILLMLGPSIPAGARIPPVRAVDLYPLFADIMNLEPAPGLDGEAGALRGALDAAAP